VKVLTCESPYMSLGMEINNLWDKQDFDLDIDEECFDYQDELLNFDRLMMFSRD